MVASPKTETETRGFQDQDQDSEVPRPRPRLEGSKTKTETKTCKNGSRDQDSSLENSKSEYQTITQLYESVQKRDQRNQRQVQANNRMQEKLTRVPGTRSCRRGDMTMAQNTIT